MKSKNGRKRSQCNFKKYLIIINYIKGPSPLCVMFTI